MYGGVYIKHIANVMTLSRILFAVLMICSIFCSLNFWICYLWCGISDILDGYLARKLRLQSVLGAKLDSISDFIFAIAILSIVIRNMDLPLYIWLYVVSIAIIRLISYSVGFYRYHMFTPLHTLLNKATGACIFAFPLLYAFFGFDITGALISMIAFLSSIEELAIMIKSKEYDSDTKTIFMLQRTI